MKVAMFVASLSLLVEPAGVVASAQPENPAPRQSAPEAAEIEAARAAIAAVDVSRMYDQPDYARGVLRHLDVLDRSTDDGEMRLAIDTLRLSGLSALEEHSEIRTVVGRVLARRPNSADPYNAAWWASLSIPDRRLAVSVIEQASRLVPGVGWADLRDALGPQNPAYLLMQLKQDNDEPTRERLAEALYRIGWPGGGNLERSNDLRRILLDYRIDERNIPSAHELAAGLTEPMSVLSVVVLRRFDPLFGSNEDRLAQIRRAIAEYDRLTLEAVGSEPRVGAVFDRARFLRRLGRNREALALMEPFTRDVPATVAGDYRGMWVINEAAYALLDLGRNDEAVAVMEPLLDLPIAENTQLIGPFINHAIILNDAGRPAEALAYATRIERDFGRFASDYGKLEIATAQVCSLAALNRAGEAAPLLARLRAAGEDHPGPLTSAYLCLGDIAAAEALVVRRLQGESAESVLLALQDYQLQDDAPAIRDPVDDRLVSLRDRPAVRAALERVGHVLPVPLARLSRGGN